MRHLILFSLERKSAKKLIFLFICLIAASEKSQSFNFFNSLSFNPGDFFQNFSPKNNPKTIFKNLNSKLETRIDYLKNVFDNHKKAVQRDFSNSIFNQIAFGIRPQRVANFESNIISS